MTGTQRTWFIGLLLPILTAFVYLPAMRGGFIWDDDEHVTQNAVVVGPLGLREIWTTSAARICPLTLSCFWLQHVLWGIHPMPYHLVNIAMHAISAVLLWRILLRFHVPGAWFGALFWALHPVQVESVAWITELKNTQSCMFYLLTILCFLKWMDVDQTISRSRRERNYIVAVVFAVLAMASKSSTVILPVVLGLCGWWLNGRWDWRDVYRLVPFFVLAAFASGVSIWTADIERAGDRQWVRTWPEKLAIAGNVGWFYLGKLLWPHPLIFIYPRWDVDTAKAYSYLPTVAVCGVLLFLWWNRQGRLRPVFFAFAYFLVALLPVLGLVDHYFLRYSFVGDHFQYLASTGAIALVAACGAKLCRYAGKRGGWIGGTLGALVAIMLGSQTWRYESVFADNESLWRDTLSKNKSAWIAHNNLGNILATQGNFGEAIGHYKSALKLNPSYAQSHNNLGVARVALGQPLEAIVHYTEAMRLKPSYSDAEQNLKIAQTILSNLANAQYNRGLALSAQRKYAEAIVHYVEALRLSPNDAEVHHSLGIALSYLGNHAEAILHFTEALRLKPDYPEAHNNFGIVLTQLDRRAEAETHFLEALRLNPDHADAQANLERIRSQ